MCAYMVLANIWCAVDFTLLQMSGNMKQKWEASTLSVQILASVRLSMADMLWPMLYVTKWTGIQVSRETNLADLYVNDTYSIY